LNLFKFCDIENGLSEDPEVGRKYGKSTGASLFFYAPHRKTAYKIPLEEWIGE
jgi:hypothetical protein